MREKPRQESSAFMQRRMSIMIIKPKKITADTTLEDDLLAAAYQADGAVDGILERVDGHEKLQIVIYDLIDERAVKCEILDIKLLNQALLNFKRRVEVIGSVKYRKDGMPVSIKVSRMVNYPEKSEIPSIVQMRSLLAGGH